MSSYDYSFAEILRENLDTNTGPKEWDFAEDIASALYERYEDLPPITQWPEAVRFFFVCYELNFQVGNGGFSQAAFNVPELLPIAEQAFESLGLREAALLCKKAIALLPDELTSQLEKGLTETESIQDVFDHFNESEMAALNEQIPDEFWAEERLQELVSQNRSDFEAVDQML